MSTNGGLAMTRVRLVLAALTSTAILAAAAPAAAGAVSTGDATGHRAAPAAPEVPLISQCSSGTGYQYSGYYSSNYTNAGLQGDIDVSKLNVGNINNQHALIYVSSQSKADGNAGAGSDWLQVGYGKGDVDNNITGTVAVYEEASDYNTSGGAGPVAHWYNYDIGNHYFMTYYQGQTDSHGRGLYKAWYGLGSNSHYLGEAWEVGPTANRLFGQFEGDTFIGGSENCPSLSWGLYGSTGDISNVKKTVNTEMMILNSSSSWVDWAYGKIATTLHLNGNYSLTDYNAYDLFESQGS